MEEEVRVLLMMVAMELQRPDADEEKRKRREAVMEK
ncbi:hypothetical protein COLO4_35873 [Corchorus olitorius]|uniref:Uncharacterized protein n=1 Tax=Corchorus olitorius TaxID=93759 RepID=A0A1R3GCM9_9ROSI|nr:hypothetical protein COLO4_35873 [Corchorus olitorius]